MCLVRCGLRLALKLEKLCFLCTCLRIFALSLYGPVRPHGQGVQGQHLLHRWLLTPQSKLSSMRNLFESSFWLGEDVGRGSGSKKELSLEDIWEGCREEGSGLVKFAYNFSFISWWHLASWTKIFDLINLNMFHDLSQDWRLYLGFWRQWVSLCHEFAFSPISLLDLQFQGVSKIQGPVSLFHEGVGCYGLNCAPLQFICRSLNP